MILGGDFTSGVHGMINIETTAGATALLGYGSKESTAGFPQRALESVSGDAKMDLSVVGEFEKLGFNVAYANSGGQGGAGMIQGRGVRSSWRRWRIWWGRVRIGIGGVGDGGGLGGRGFRVRVATGIRMRTRVVIERRALGRSWFCLLGGRLLV